MSILKKLRGRIQSAIEIAEKNHLLSIENNERDLTRYWQGKIDALNEVKYWDINGFLTHK